MATIETKTVERIYEEHRETQLRVVGAKIRRLVEMNAENLRAREDLERSVDELASTIGDVRDPKKLAAIRTLARSILHGKTGQEHLARVERAIDVQERAIVFAGGALVDAATPVAVDPAGDVVPTDPDHPCPRCGAPGVMVCLGCGWPTMSPRDCGCPCGTGFRCSTQCTEESRSE